VDCFVAGLLQALLVAHSDLALSAQAVAFLSLQQFSPANTGIAANEANAKQTMIFFIGFINTANLSFHQALASTKSDASMVTSFNLLFRP